MRACEWEKGVGKFSINLHHNIAVLMSESFRMKQIWELFSEGELNQKLLGEEGEDFEGGDCYKVRGLKTPPGVTKSN